MNGVAQGIKDCADFIVDFRRQVNGVEGGKPEIFGKGARHIHANTLGFGIKVEMSGAGHAAFHADQMAFAGNPVAHFHGADMAADFGYHAGIFMAHHHGHGNGFLGPLVPFPDVQVGAADAGFGNLDENVIGADLGDGFITENEAFLGFSFDQRAHQTTPSSLPTAVKAAMAISISCDEWAADICVLILALPCGTTGKKKPVT